MKTTPAPEALVIRTAFPALAETLQQVRMDIGGIHQELRGISSTVFSLQRQVNQANATSTTVATEVSTIHKFLEGLAPVNRLLTTTLGQLISTPQLPVATSDVESVAPVHVSESGTTMVHHSTYLFHHYISSLQFNMYSYTSQLVTHQGARSDYYVVGRFVAPFIG